MPGAVNARASVAPVSRRRVLTAAGATAFAALASHLGPCAAAPSLPVQGASGRIVESSEYLYAIPSSGLSKNTASLNGGRVATIFVDESDGDSNISCVETPIQSDFQKLTSFGPIDNVRTYFEISLTCCLLLLLPTSAVIQSLFPYFN